MSDYMEHLRRLALHDDALLTAIAIDGSSFAAYVIDKKTEALARIAATVALDGASASIQHVVACALVAGATCDEIVATLEAVAPVIGTARTVACAAKVGLALGYDVEEALE
jgi:alkylhydroperoxidase/carboxymuconolactone decarboxylase family protein YurZ